MAESRSESASLASQHLCPCGRGDRYSACCGPLHAGEAAPTAERLMRSRYSAFALGLEDYLRRSWHASTRPSEAEVILGSETRWIRLIIESTDAGGPFDTRGIVEFTAVARTAEGRREQRERSRFVREEGHWFYIDGEAS